jgi:hypothetical protein
MEAMRAAVIGHHRGVAITESVYGQVGAHVPTRQLPDFRVKWQSTPMKVWEIIA